MVQPLHGESLPLPQRSMLSTRLWQLRYHRLLRLMCLRYACQRSRLGAEWGVNATLGNDSSGAMVLLISYRFPYSWPSIMAPPSGPPIAMCPLHFMISIPLRSMQLLDMRLSCAFGQWLTFKSLMTWSGLPLTDTLISMVPVLHTLRSGPFSMPLIESLVGTNVAKAVCSVHMWFVAPLSRIQPKQEWGELLAR